jgi:type VI secretion system secreted protein VgrG
MRLLAGYTNAELGLGHLIQQSSGSANRGAWRGSGFEANTQGWASVRAAKGLLISTTARAGSYGSAQSTQMDAAEALALLKGGNDLGKRLGDAAKAATAQGLASFEAGQSVEKLLEQIDPKKQGKHPGSVNGQEAKKANGRTLTDPVEAFATPLIVIDTPSTAALATEAGIAAFTGQDASITAQGDTHQTAAHTWASVSGKTTSWYVHEGGVKAYSANGPLTLRAHTDELQILADKDVTVISVNDEIRISASTKIEMIAGQSSIVLEGANIEFKTPGAFTVKSSAHAFLGGSSGAATPPHLPTGLTTVPPEKVQFRHAYHDGEPTPGAEYSAKLGDGSVRKGRLDTAGFVQFDNVPAGSIDITLGPDPRAYEKFKLPAVADDAMNEWSAA